MIAAIYQGLTYGLIAAFSVIGCVLTIASAIVIIELTFKLEEYITGENSNGEQQRRGDKS